MGHTTGRRIAVQGTVQGVGFRPWVYQLAHELKLPGAVKNGPDGVTIDVFGPGDTLDRFVARLETELPPAARLETLTVRELTRAPPERFEILPSDASGAARPSIPADLSLCDACRAEVNDPHARRFQYPFTNCTHCGPRFSIAEAIPYDRPHTTMAGFPLCDACRAEYGDPLDRRFHAQPIACPACGPRLAWREADGSPRDVGDVLEAAAQALVAGRILAVRGLGGFHLACDATNAAAVAELRRRKHREEKPFAVMVPSLDWADRLAELSPAERALLTSPARPIVLAPGRGGDGELVGLFLPYTPLHELLLGRVERPLVMTSGNRSDEPMAVDTDDAVVRLRGIADGFVVHDRPIATRTDDSVARVVDGAPLLVRRARGYVPDPLRAPIAFREPVLAVGGQLKNAFCIGQRDLFTLGPHVGDLGDAATFDDFTRLVGRLERFLECAPSVIAHDLHPDYESTVYALRRAGRHVSVQHHHAHVAAVMAEHQLTGPVLGLAFDGAGYGADGAAWGGEFLRCTPARFERLATFRPLALVGGERAIRSPWRLALAALDDAFDGAPPLERLALFERVPSRDVANVRAVVRAGEAMQAHGVGRCFDAAAALILGRPAAGFEAQLAMALEARAATARGDDGPWPFELDAAGVDLRPMWRALVADLLVGEAASTLAARFHATVAAAAVALTRRLIARHGPMPVALAGGCFANARLTAAVAAGLRGLDVRLPRRAPPGDGGLALGQAYVAAALLHEPPPRGEP